MGRFGGARTFGESASGAPRRRPPTAYRRPWGKAGAKYVQTENGPVRAILQTEKNAASQDRGA